jgi:hypothetical protein
VTARSPARSRIRLFRGRGDLPPLPRLPVGDQQWANKTEAVALLRGWAEDRATETIAWYLRDKQGKRWGSRLLRGGAVTLAVAGGVIPLVSGSVIGVNSNLGYIFLAIAVGCVAFDHFFGLSNGWMRDIAAISALRRAFFTFQLDWAKWEAVCTGAIGNGQATTQAETLDVALKLIEVLVTSVDQITEAETMQWITEFSTSVAALRQQANPGVSSPQDLFTWSSKGGGLSAS